MKYSHEVADSNTRNIRLSPDLPLHETKHAPNQDLLDTRHSPRKPSTTAYFILTLAADPPILDPPLDASGNPGHPIYQASPNTVRPNAIRPRQRG